MPTGALGSADRSDGTASKQERPTISTETDIDRGGANPLVERGRRARRAERIAPFAVERERAAAR
jgi:hypothetical protein